MTAPTSSTYDWLKTLPTSLLKLDTFPLLGYPPEFSWDKFSSDLGQILQIPDLLISPGEVEWRTSESLLEGLGSHLKPLHFNVSGLDGSICWILPESDIRVLMAILLKQDEFVASTINEDYIEGFYRFLTLETLQAISRIDFGKAVSPHVLEKSDLPQGDALCQDIMIQCEGHSFVGRLIIPPEFRLSWSKRFSNRKFAIPPGLSDSLQLIIHLEGGRTTLKRSEWKSVKPGDFILLDFCSLDPDAEKGRVMLTLNGKALFRAKIKDGNIKILEHPLYHEVETTMPNQPPGNEFEEGDDELDEEFEIEDNLLDEEFEEEEYEELKEPQAQKAQVQKKEPAETPQAPAKGEEEEKVGLQLSSEGKAISAEDIPLSITIEVGRIQISLQKLLELQPGNLLELDIRPENGVDLVVSGNKIGKGELLRIGDSLGIRIIDIG